MTNYGMPFFLEDRTGDFFNTEYDDLNDRLFYGVNCVVGGAGRAPGASTVRIFELGSRTSAHRFSTAYPGRSPAVMLDFGPRGELGTVLFVERAAALPMSNWMRKSMALGRAFERKFRCSDGQDYIWSYTGTDEHEWTCTTDSGYLAAEYKLKVPEEPSYHNSSGNMLTIYEAYGHVSIELVASFTIMRHIKRHNL